MESEQSQNFNERLSQWVAGQGFWFQIRYSMLGSGTKGRAMFHILRLGLRVMIFALLLAAGVGYYLVKRPSTAGFFKDVQSALKAGLGASEIELRGVRHVQGELDINGVACKGGDQSFFSSLDARNLRCNMGFLDEIVGRWNPGTIFVARLDLDLRAGADDAEGAKQLGEALFKKFNKIDLKSFEVADATVRWGYSRTVAPKTISISGTGASAGYEFDHTRGSIENSFLRIQRGDDQIRLSFKGGYFSQNWLERLDIVDLEIVCTPDGMIFEKAEFRRLQGTVNFSGLKVTGGARPLVNGTVKIRNLPLAGALPPPVRSFVEGSLSGDFQVSGSTNSSDGIIFDGEVTLGDGDVISLRERLHLLKALSVVDYARNYHRIDFGEGAFRLRTAGGGLELSSVMLKSEDLTTLEGKISVRLPTVEETLSADNDSSALGGVPLFNGQDQEMDPFEKAVDDEFTLRRAAMAAKREKSAGQGDTDTSLFKRLELNEEKRRIGMLSSDRVSRNLRYSGALRLMLPPDVFERAPRLIAQFPVETTTGRVPLMVPIEGGLYELTLKQAEDIYQQGRR